MNDDEKKILKSMLDEIDSCIDRASECVAYLNDKFGLYCDSKLGVSDGY